MHRHEHARVFVSLEEVLHPRQASKGSGFEGAAWVRWGAFSIYGVKLHLLCATNRVPISYEITAANVADVRLMKELLAEAELGGGLTHKVFGDRAYTHAFYINRMLGRSQGKIKELWA